MANYCVCFGKFIVWSVRCFCHSWSTHTVTYEMSPFWRIFRHCLKWKLTTSDELRQDENTSKWHFRLKHCVIWQLTSSAPVMEMLSTWWYFLIVYHMRLQLIGGRQCIEINTWHFYCLSGSKGVPNGKLWRLEESLWRNSFNTPCLLETKNQRVCPETSFWYLILHQLQFDATIGNHGPGICSQLCKDGLVWI